MGYEILFLLCIAALIYIVVKYGNNTSTKLNPKELGEVGENYIQRVIGESIPGEQYIVNDLYLEDSKGKTSQIDHIVINKNGIFVIETKNYAGRIYGRDDQQQWTQVLSYGKSKKRFYNPVKQNATHIFKLKEITGTQLPIKSIVVFIQGNIHYIESTNVYRPQDLNNILAKPLQKEISTSEIENFYNQLIKLKEENTITESEHIENIHKTMIETAQGICPRCGKKLVQRKGKYGIFYGCSNYPNCKFTKK